MESDDDDDDDTSAVSQKGLKHLRQRHAVATLESDDDDDVSDRRAGIYRDML